MLGESRTRGLIDTNVVIHLPALDPAGLPEEMVISAVTLAELSAGPHCTDEPTERADPLPFDAEAARAYGLIVAAAIAAGRLPRRRIADLMIASTAFAHRLPLFTINPSDFAGLDAHVSIVQVGRPSEDRQPGRLPVRPFTCTRNRICVLLVP